VDRIKTMNKIVEKIKGIIKKHCWIIILSFLLTTLIFAPLIVFPYIIKNEYQGININHFGSDAHFYLTRGKEVLGGHGLGNPVLREGKEEADMLLYYSDYILLAPIKLLGLADKVDIVTVYNAYNFIGVFLLILLIYLFAWQLSGSKLLSAAAALFVIGGYSIIYFKTLFYNDFNVYSRVIYPYFSSLVTFIYLNLLIKALKSPELKFKILSAFSFGLLFYVYFYAWSFALALNGLLFLIFLFKKDFLSVKKILLISVGGLVLGSFYLFRLFPSLYSEIGNQKAYFIRMSSGTNPIFSKIGFATLVLFAIFWYLRRKDNNLFFILAIILSGWVALNQQIITGKMLQYGHYYWYFIVPLSIIVSFYMVWQLIENKKWEKYLFVFIIILAFVNTIGGQYKSFFTTFETKKYEQNFRPIIDYLNRDKTPGVILSPSSLTNSYLFTIYTSHDLFWHLAASFSNVPIQRFKDALFVYVYLNKDARNDFRVYLEKISDNKAGESFDQFLYRSLEGYWSGFDYYAYTNKLITNDSALAQKRPAIIDGLSKEYNETILKNNGIDKLLKQYGVNYIVWDKNNDPEWDLSGIAGLNEVADSNNIFLFQVQ